MDDTNETLEAQAGKENYNFVQVSKGYLKAWRELTNANPLASSLLMYLIEVMGRTSNAVVCSQQTLAEVSGVSTRSVQRALKSLRDDNWIETVRIGNAVAIAVNARAFWQAARNQKHYAMFSATVIAGMEEQASDFRKKSQEKLRMIPFVDKADRVISGNEALPPPDQQDLPLA